MSLKQAILFLILAFLVANIHAQLSQQPEQDAIAAVISPKYLEAASDKAIQIEKKLDAETNKILKRLQRQELRIQKRLVKIDSVKAKELFENAKGQYALLEQKVQNNRFDTYIPTLDSIETSLKFLKLNPQMLSTAKYSHQKLQQTLTNLNRMKGQLQKAEDIKKFIKERRQYLKDQLTQLGFAKELKKFSKQSYYAIEQLNSYKDMIKDHKKAERKALALLSKTKQFQNFFRKNSFLSSLFRLPGESDDPVNMVNLSGLQTRSSVTTLIQNQLAAGGPNAQQQLQQNLQQAQSQLTQLKNKIIQSGAGSSDAEIPEGFRKNNQRVKNFWQKWEVGINIQSNRGNGIYPVSSDLGLSVGFRPHDNFIIGGGFAARIGWGKNIRHIDITYSGVGFRSFAELKIKGSFHAATGFEMNYRPEIRTIDQLKDKSAWQSSGLVGLSKIVSQRSRLFKKTKLQLLLDLLSGQQIPRTQKVVFRIGYNF